MKQIGWSTPLLLLIVVLAGACQTGSRFAGVPTSGATGGPETDRVQYTSFFTPGDHVEQLLGEGKVDQAAQVYQAHKESWFEKPTPFGDPPKESWKSTLRQLADRLHAGLEAEYRAHTERLQALSTLPGPRDSWAEKRQLLTEVSRLEARRLATPLINEPGFTADYSRALQAARQRVTDTLEAGIDQALSAFDLEAMPGFFETYPLQPDRPEAIMDRLAEVILPRLEGFSATGLARFATVYPLSPELKARVGVLHARAVERALSAQLSPLERALKVMVEAKKAGFKPRAPASLRIGILDATSTVLLKSRKLEFKPGFIRDLPLDMVKTSLEDALSPGSGLDYLVVIQTALAQVRRKVFDTETRHSTLVTSYQMVENPEYRNLQMEYQNSNLSLMMDQRQSTSCSKGYGDGIQCSSSQGIADPRILAKRQFIQTRLRKLPPMVQQPVHAPYSYKVAPIHSRKTLTLNHYLIDLKARTYQKVTSDHSGKETFTVAYGLHHSDPNRGNVLESLDEEEDVTYWETGEFQLPLSGLLRSFANSGSGRIAFASADALLREMTQDRNAAVASNSTYDVDELSRMDPRFDSVVVVVQLGGGQGSGFYVEPNLVMTNYHVVEGARFVSLIRHDKTETFGRVVRSDVTLDLALIQVQDAGPPVQWHRQHSLPPGTPVEVIGHPKDLRYSITRGVVSAVREMQPVMFASAEAPIKVRYLQIDAATSPGNSGGPVFVKDRVVGVVDWGNVSDGAQNLNFAIHCTEALRFLEELKP
ncbi:MAG: trypsin-like peptidase domain-containing protein [Magnetococcales bacterium]|nr:trypsin-like peptidase domain-containing protein [Magnetococcales bacterium]